MVNELVFTNNFTIMSSFFLAVEKALEESAGQYCVGDELSIADCCLIPQLYAARRFVSILYSFIYLNDYFLSRYNVDLTVYPIMTAIEERLNTIPAFKDAHPNEQPDFPEPENQKS